MKFGFLNDHFLPTEDIKLDAMDLATQRGFGVFDYFRLIEGRNKVLDGYLDRFFNSMQLADLHINHSKSDVKNIVHQLINKNGNPNSCIKMITTGGVSHDGYTPPEMGNFLVYNLPYTPPTEQQLSTGVNLITHLYQRPMPSIKSTNYICSILLNKKKTQANAIDVLYYHPDSIFETSRCNVFVVKNRIVKTPKSGMLSGMTRKRIIELKDKPYPLQLTKISKQELDDADEVFITSTTKDILPVVNIDGIKVGNGAPGSITMDYLRCLQAHNEI